MTGEADNTSTHNKLLLLRTRDLDEWDSATLIAWSRDPDDGVRDWATFALGARDDDGQEMRQALLDRIDDPDFDTRSEALVGLARRRDERALQPLIDALEEDLVGMLIVEAAGYFARPELVEPLERLVDWWDVDEPLLAEAICRCRGELFPNEREWGMVPSNDNPA